MLARLIVFSVLHFQRLFQIILQGEIYRLKLKEKAAVGLSESLCVCVYLYIYSTNTCICKYKIAPTYFIYSYHWDYVIAQDHNLYGLCYVDYDIALFHFSPRS